MQPLSVASIAETTAVGSIAEATIVIVAAAFLRPVAKPTTIDNVKSTEVIPADSNI